MFSSLESSIGKAPNASISEFTVSLSASVGLRVYSNSQPNNLKIARLQKGLVFVYNGVEQVGEGAGFGLPILVYRNETYFSGSSIVRVKYGKSSVQICKEFLMDHVNRSSFRNIYLHNDEVRKLLNLLAELYQNNKLLQSVAFREISLNLGIQSVYLKVPAIGRLFVTYEIERSLVKVSVDYSQISKKHLKKVVVLNEQSANFFRYYHDSNTMECDARIPAWESVRSKWACLLDPKQKIGYRLFSIENSTLHRGREVMPNFLDWIGLDYELSPRQGTFEYNIQLLGVNN